MDKKLNILVVEDSEDDALLSIIQIKKGGYDVYYECVETQDDMYAALNEKAWDIILSDYKMPRFNGLDALKLLKKTDIDIPFIIISGTIGEEIAVMAMKEGAHDYIMKQNLKRLLPAVERELREAKNRGERRRIEQKRKQAEETLRRTNRKLQAISNCNQALMRADDEPTLLNAICRIICNVAGYQMAWVGYAENDDAKTIKPVAWAGFESGYISNAKLSWAEDMVRGQGPAGIAIRSGKVFFVQDFETDPKMAPWKESAMQRGYRSGMALPLKNEDSKVFGVLLIYYSEPNIIDSEEIELMSELAGDLSFGINTIRSHKERTRVEKALQKSEHRKTILNKIAAIFLTIPDEEIYHEVLFIVLDLTKSRFGLFGFIEENGDLVIPSMTREVWNECQIPGKSIVFPPATWGESLWGKAINQKKTFLSEGPFHFPIGHIQIENFIAVPIIFGDTSIGLLSFANNQSGFTNEDKDLLEEISKFISPILNARLQRDRKELVRKQTENELIRSIEKTEESEIRLKRMFNSMKAGVAVYQAVNNGNDFVFLDFNNAAERITNKKKENVLTKSLLDIFPNMKDSPLFKAFQQVYIEEKDIELPPFCYNYSERQGWFENYIYKLPSGEIVEIFHDVTKREEYQRALLESEIKFRSIYEMAEDMICVTDLQTMSFLDVNPSGLRNLGYTKKEFLKHLIIEYVHPDDVEQTRNIFNDKLQNGKTVTSFVIRFKCKSGNYRWLDWSIHPIAEKNIAYAIAHDITEIKKYQSELENHRNNLEKLVKERTQLLEKTLKELKDAETQLIQTEKMASLGILTAGVAHEINNPLNYIQTSIYGLENMFKHGFDGDILEKLIMNMKVGVNKASAIVKSLNTFSRKGQGKLSPCNINVIIENCLLILNHELKKNCKVTKNFTNDSFIFMANEENLHQVFINLIMNSLQAIESEGEISISTQLIIEKELLQINVIDNGEGISDENLSKIFDPFFTTKEPGKGIGIGLSIVYKIITDHQGTINYKSELSKGTQVTINFPIKIMSQHENERKI